MKGTQMNRSYFLRQQRHFLIYNKVETNNICLLHYAKFLLKIQYWSYFFFLLLLLWTEMRLERFLYFFIFIFFFIFLYFVVLVLLRYITIFTHTFNSCAIKKHVQSEWLRLSFLPLSFSSSSSFLLVSSMNMAWSNVHRCHIECTTNPSALSTRNGIQKLYCLAMTWTKLCV